MVDRDPPLCDGMADEVDDPFRCDLVTWCYACAFEVGRAAPDDDDVLRDVPRLRHFHRDGAGAGCGDVEARCRGVCDPLDASGVACCRVMCEGESFEEGDLRGGCGRSECADDRWCAGWACGDEGLDLRE